MIVVKEPAEFQPFEVTCGICATVMKVEALEDLRRYRASCHDGDDIDCPVVDCPRCQTRIFIDHEIPHHLYRQIQPL